MSLQIWLPLCNGKVENQGLADVKLTTSANWATTGKVGPKGFTNGSVTAATMKNIYNNTGVSIAFWFYPNAADSTATGNCIIGTSGMTPPNNRKFSIFNYPNINDLHWSWQNEASSTFTSGVLNDIFPSYKWTHVAFAYGDGKTTVYINGVAKATSTGISASASFDFSTPICNLNSS